MLLKVGNPLTVPELLTDTVMVVPETLVTTAPIPIPVPLTAIPFEIVPFTPETVMVLVPEVPVADGDVASVVTPPEHGELPPEHPVAVGMFTRNAW